MVWFGYCHARMCAAEHPARASAFQCLSTEIKFSKSYGAVSLIPVHGADMGVRANFSTFQALRESHSHFHIHTSTITLPHSHFHTHTSTLPHLHTSTLPFPPQFPTASADCFIP